MPIGTKKVTSMTAQGHSKMNLLSIAPIQYYEREYPSKASADFVAAANDCMRECEKVGIYDPLRVRGRGAWFDNGRIVLHTGNRLIVDGEKKTINSIKSNYIYEAQIPTEESDDFYRETLPTEESKKLVEITDLISWENSIFSRLFAGWLTVAPICGALEWRPHIWITGESDSGKSWIQDNIISMILDKVSVNATSNSTESGIRQLLGNDAFPVRVDEIETETPEAFVRVQKILELARQASSNKDAAIIKGTPGGQCQCYMCRSCFLFTSVNPKLIQQADERRITLLKLAKRADWEENNTFEVLKKMVHDTLTPKYCRLLRARAIKLIPIIRKNFTTFSIVMSSIMKSKGAGDQIGSLLAGCYALVSDDLIRYKTAEKWASGVNWAAAQTRGDKTDQAKCLETIFQQIVKTDIGTKTEAIGSLVRKAVRVPQGFEGLDTANQIHSDRLLALDTLRKFGITAIKNRDSGAYEIGIAENHSLLKKLLKDSPWHNGYKLVLSRFPGARVKTATFADQVRSSAIAIPIDNLFDPDSDNMETVW